MPGPVPLIFNFQSSIFNYYAAIRIHEQNILRSLCPAVHDRTGRATGILVREILQVDQKLSERRT